MPFLGLIFGSKIGLIVTAVVLGIGAFFTWLAVHDSNVWKKATEAFNTSQNELVQKREEEFKQQSNTINDNAQRIRDEIAKQLAESNQAAAKIEEQAATDSKNKGGEQASDYLKSVVQQLDKSYGQKK